MALNIRWLAFRRKTGADAAPVDQRAGEITVSEPGHAVRYGFGGVYGETPAAVHLWFRSDGSRLWHDNIGAADGSTAFKGTGAELTSIPWTSLTAMPAAISSVAGLTPAADRMPYYTGSGTAALATITSAARALLDDSDAAAMRTTLGVILQTAAGDETAGSVLTNGAHGLGRRGAAVTDLNFLAPHGVSFATWATPTALNRPPAIDRGVVLSARWGASSAGQLAFGEGGAAWRVTSDNCVTWSAWTAL